MVYLIFEHREDPKLLIILQLAFYLTIEKQQCTMVSFHHNLLES